jgi:hypothetical protein
LTVQLEERRATLQRELRWLASDERRAGASSDSDRLAEVAERSRQIGEQIREIEEEIADAAKSELRCDQVDAAFAEFRPLWDQLSTRERTELLRSLIKTIEYDGKAGEVTLVFHPESSRLAAECKS